MFCLYDFECKDNDNFCYIVLFVHKSNKKNISSYLRIMLFSEYSFIFANESKQNKYMRYDT